MGTPEEELLLGERRLPEVGPREKPPLSPLHQAAKDADVSKVHLLLGAGTVDANSPDADGSTPLFGAVSSGCVDTVRALLAHGAKVNVRNPDENSVLHVAAREDRPLVLAAILENSPELGVPNKNGESPIRIAVTKGHLEICTQLCQSGADVNEVAGDDGLSLLHIAIVKEHTKIAMELIKHGAQLDIVDGHGNIPLHLAAKLGFENQELVKLLINKGEKHHLKQQNADGNTPLHVAAKGGHYKAVMLLLDHNAPVDIPNSNYDTPLHLVAKSGYAVSMKLIMNKNKYLLNVENGEKNLPLHMAITAGKLNTVKVILDEYAADNDLWNKFLDKENRANPPCVMDMAVDTGNALIVSLLIHHPHWKHFLLIEHYNEAGERCTPMRYLIQKMPDMAKLVFDKCWHFHRGQLTAHFDLVDDMYCKWDDIQDEATGSQMSLWSTEDIPKYARGTRPYSKKKKLLKNNHPLKMIADTNAHDLMDHPLITALLRRKWRLAAAVYFSFLVYYFSFISLMTSVMVLSEPPFGQPACINVSSKAESKNAVMTSLRSTTFAFAVFGILLEFLQLFFTKVQHYMEFHNILDWFTYVAPIAILSSVGSCGEFEDWQWQLGVASLFVSYMNLLFFFRIIPMFGIYIMMVAMMLRNFMHFFIIVFLFLVSFGMCFTLLVQNQLAFSQTTYSVMKSYMMMLGDLDFGGIFLEHLQDDDPGTQLYYEGMVWTIYIAFLVFMSLVIMNLLTSLAVSGIETLQEDSKYKIMSLQINLALDVEFAMPAFLHSKYHCCVKFQKYSTTADRAHFMSMLMENLEKLFYGSLRQKEILKQATAIVEGTVEDEELEIETTLTVKDVENCIVRKTRSLRSEVKEIERTVDKLKDFSAQLDKKLDTITEMLQTIMDKTGQ